MKLNLIIILAIFFSMAFFSLSVVSAGTCPNGIGVCDETIPFQSANNVITPAINYTTALNGSYVPYTGATSNVDLGAKQLLTTGNGTFGSTYKVTVGGPSYGVDITSGGLRLASSFLYFGTDSSYPYIYSSINNMYLVSANYLGIFGTNITGTGTISMDKLNDGTLEIHAGSITGGVDSTFSGTIRGGTLTDGTCSISGGILSGCSGIAGDGGWQPNNNTESRNYNTTGNVSVHDLSVSGKANITEDLHVQNNLMVNKNTTINGLVGIGTAPATGYAVKIGTSEIASLWAYTTYSGSNQNMYGAFTQVYGSSSNANPRAYGGLFQAYNYGTTMRNLASAKSSQTIGGVFNAADRVSVSYGENGTHYFQGGWFYVSSNLGNWTSNPAVVLQDGLFGTSGFNESAWGTNSQHYAIYAYPAKNGVDFSSNNVTTTGGITASKLNITGNVAIGGNLSVKRPYWNGYDNSTQNFLNTANAQVINISNNEDHDSYGIRVVGSQNLTFDMTGDYLCILSPEFFQNGGGALVTFWYQKCTSGVCVDARWSNSRYSMSNNEYHAPAIPYQFDITDPATETVRFMWWSDSTSTQIYSSGALTLPTRPSIPGIILNCQKVSEIA